MNKFLLTLIGVMSVAFLSAADLETLSGTKYINVELKRAVAGCVTIEHDDGSATIMLDDLPESFIAALSSRQRASLQNLADIKLADGTVYSKCSIVMLVDNTVTITHVDGTAEIKVDQLPRCFVATFTRKQLEALKRQPTPELADTTSGTPTDQRTVDGRTIYVGPRGGRYYINENGTRGYIRSNAGNSR